MIIKKIYNRLKRIYDFIFKTRCIYSLWFNFKYLPFNYAKCVPLIFYPNARAEILKGARIFLSEEFINNRYKKVHIGYDDNDFAHNCEKTIFRIAGSAKFLGKTLILRGARLDVNGFFEIGDDAVIGSLSRIRVYNKVIIGDNSRIAHEVQIFDTNFHYIVDVNNFEFKPMSRPIIIGNNCWIGNRTTINPGTIIPDFTIVTSNSLVNKDYSDIDPYTLIGGLPCKVIKSGIVRVWDRKIEHDYKLKEFEWYRNLNK